MEKDRDHPGTVLGKAELSEPARRPGRPRQHADEVKREPLAIRTTASLKHALVKVSKTSGRSLAQEIEYRLWRSFDGNEFVDAENHLGILLDSALEDFDERLTGIRAILREVQRGKLHRASSLRDGRPSQPGKNIEPEPKSESRTAQRGQAGGELPAGTDPADAQHGGPGEADGQPGRVMHADPGRLLPVDIRVVRGDDGTVVLVRRHGELVIHETPLDIGRAQWLAGALLEACGSGQKEQPASTGPKRRQSGRSR